ncbi:MAG TPA: hypothetical protein VIQ31_29665 [Phormidium sp.]
MNINQVDQNNPTAQEIEQDLSNTYNQVRISQERVQLQQLNLKWVKRWQLRNFEFYPIVHTWFVDLYLKHFGNELNSEHPRIHAMRILQTPGWEITQEIYLEILRLEVKEKEKEEQRRKSAELIQQVQNRLIQEDDKLAEKACQYQNPSFFQKLDLFQSSLDKIPAFMWEKVPTIMKGRIEEFKPIALLRVSANGKPCLRKLSITEQIELIQKVIDSRNYEKAALYVQRFNEVNLNLTFTLHLYQVNQQVLLRKNKR